MNQLSSLVILALIGFAYSEGRFAPSKRYDVQYKISAATLGGEGIYYDEPSEYIPNEDHHSGYSLGSGLRSIAQGSANQAHSAVASQKAAAQQAAYIAKNTLAQSAVQSAATANAALAGKEVLLRAIEKQSTNARQSLEAEIAQLNIAQKSTSSVQSSAEHAANHVRVLTTALNSAESVARHAEQAATNAAFELASQIAMVGKAKSSLRTIEHKLHMARIDFNETKEAARKATSSAQEAQENAEHSETHDSHSIRQTSAFRNAPSEEVIRPVVEEQNE